MNHLEKYTFVKLAFNPADALKLLKAVKKRTIKLPTSLHAAGPAVISSKAEHVAFFNKVKKLFGQGIPEERFKMIMQGPVPHPPGLMMNRSYITMPQKGDAWNFIKHIAGGKKLTPVARRQMNAIFAGHEQAEAVALRPKNTSLVFRNMGHASPEVIMKEHNKLVTSPAYIRKQIEQPMMEMRNLMGSRGEVGILKQVGIDYGKGHRISRHARKRYTELLNKRYDEFSVPAQRKALKEVNDALDKYAP